MIVALGPRREFILYSCASLLAGVSILPPSHCTGQPDSADKLTVKKVDKGQFLFSQSVSYVRFTTDGRRLMVLRLGKSICSLDIEHGKLEELIPSTFLVNAFDVSDDNGLLAFTGRKNDFVGDSVFVCRISKEFPVKEDSILRLTDWFDKSDKKHVTFQNRAAKVFFVDPQGGRTIDVKTLEHRAFQFGIAWGGPGRSMSVFNHGQMLALVKDDTNIELWGIDNNRQPLGSHMGESQSIGRLAVSRLAPKFVFASGVQVFMASCENERLKVLQLDDAPMASSPIACSDDGRLIALRAFVGRGQTQLCVCSSLSGEVLQTLDWKLQPAHFGCFSADNKQLAVADGVGSVVVWPLKSAE